MYNDYYLEQINNKIGTTNLKLEDIIDNQETIIQNQKELISGDIKIIQNQQTINNNVSVGIMLLAIILLLMYIIRSLK